ncbi:unnamed protein product, partial [Staurois parvus]
GFWGEPQAVFYLILAWTYPLISIPDPKGLVWMGGGNPRRAWCGWEGGPHAVFYFIMVLVFKCTSLYLTTSL